MTPERLRWICTAIDESKLSSNEKCTLVRASEQFKKYGSIPENVEIYIEKFFASHIWRNYVSPWGTALKSAEAEFKERVGEWDAEFKAVDREGRAKRRGRKGWKTVCRECGVYVGNVSELRGDSDTECLCDECKPREETCGD